MRFVEHHNNTDEQVREYIEKALALVGELEIADDLRLEVFRQACTFYASKSVTGEVAMPAGVDLRQMMGRG